MNTIVTVVLGVILCTLVCAQDLSSLKSEYLDHVRALSNVPEGEREESIRNILKGLKVYQTGAQPEQLEWLKSSSAASISGKKVCLVATSLEGLTFNSGIGTVYASLAELLSQNGNQVTILFAQQAEGAAFEGAVARLAAAGIHLVALPAPKSTIDGPSMVKKSFEVYQYLKNTEFDLIQFPEWEGLGYYTLLAKKEGLSFGSTTISVGLHGPTHWVASANSGKEEIVSQGELELDYMERKSVELADFVWTPSQEVYAWAVEHGWKISSPSLLPLPAGKIVKNLEKVTKTRQAKELVFFGRLEVRKGLKLFCDALDELSVSDDIIVTFLGSQSIATIEGMQAIEYIESRASNWKFFWKVVADTDRADALRYLLENENRVAVIPSLTDNAPYTVYECLYLGIPFIASNIPSISSLVASKAGLFEKTPSALASALKNAVESGVAPTEPVWTVEAAENVWSTYYNTLLSNDAVEFPELESPKVSICLVHYNRPNLLLQAIESIEAQDYNNIEVVLVDDGSSMPEAVSLLEHLEAPFASRGWKIIKTSNKYLGAARNTAAKAATGKFLFFLDDDNYLKLDTVSTYVRVAENTQATLLTAAHAVFQGVEPPTDATVADRIWVPLGSSVAVGLFRNCYGDANFFVAREAFLAQQFTEETAVGFEDYEFHAKAALNGWESVVIPEALLWYRMHDDGQMIISTSSLMNRLRSLRPYAAKLNDFSPLMRFLASGEVVQRATTCGDMICNTTGGENCVNCYEDCNSICKCPGDPVSRCSGNGACRITTDNGRTKAYCDCRRNHFCCDCRLDVNKNPGKIQVATIDKRSADNVVDFKLSNSRKGVSIAVAKGTFSGPVSVCFQEYTGRNMDTYPQPFVDPFVVLPDERADPVDKSGGFFLDFVDRDTNVPQGDSMKKPIAIEWNQPEDDKSEIKSVNPYIWDDFTEEWIMPAETIKNQDLAFVRHGSSKVTFSVGYLACTGQFHMFAGARRPSRPSRTSGTRTTGSRSTGSRSTGSRTTGSRTTGSRGSQVPELSGSGTFTVSLPPSVQPSTATEASTQSAVSSEVPSTTVPPTPTQTPSTRTPSRRPSGTTSGGSRPSRPSSRASRGTPSASVSAASSLLVSTWILAIVSFVSFFFF